MSALIRLSRRIRKLRKRRRLTQQELADKIGVDGSAVAHWEAAKTWPRAEVLPKLAGALDSTVGELFGEAA